MLKALKLGLIALYVLGAVAWFLPVDHALASLRWALPALLVTHVLEFAFYVPWFRKNDRPLGPEVPMLLTFGVLHFFGIKDR